MTLPQTHLLRQVSRSCVLWLALWFGVATSVWAQALRDPTLAPAAAGITGSAGPQREGTLKTGNISVLKREGVHYLMIGTRLYGVGQRIGLARVERITETEIWLREGGQLQKIQVYSGVQRRAAAPALASKKPADAPRAVRPVRILP